MRGLRAAPFLSAAVLGACGGDTAGVVCPLLAPGALTNVPRGATLAIDDPGGGAASLVSAGGLAAHALWLAEGEAVKVSATVQGSGVLFAYGPRNVFGGFPHCRAVDTGPAPRVTIEAAEDGEYLVLVGVAPGHGTAAYTVAASCTSESCARADRCPTLADLGCADARCDGELARDERGCLSCACDPGALCGPDRQAGPSGSCVLPACTCVGAPDEPVCGTDGRTWPSPCAASCAGVPVAREGPCAIACPAVEACDAPCHGLRAIDAEGCPTCACRPDFAADAASCAACPLELAPVCGSDGVSYPNRCRARCAGAKILYAGACVDACRTAPAGCTLDCAHGLVPVAGGAHCLACACADLPRTCDPAEGPVCAVLAGPIGETTLGSGCLALALGATEGRWGPCGTRCEADDDCPEGSRCAAHGFFSGRCLASAPSVCGCSALVEPVCGVDGLTWDNACEARCAGVEVAHLGACCGEGPACTDGEQALVDRSGCPASCGQAPTPDCAGNAAFAPACTGDGVAVEGSACAAHALGLSAFVEQCP